MSLPFRQGLPFRRRGPFRGRGPFANKSPFWLNADYSFFQKRHFWNEAAYTAAPGGRKTLMSVALMAALGYTFATSTSNPPGTVIGSDGTIQYGAHNLVTYSETFTNGAWTHPQGFWTNGQADSTGGTKGTRLYSSGRLQNTIASGVPGNGRTFTVFARVKSTSGGSSPFRLWITQASVLDYYSGTQTATGSWQWFAFSQTVSASANAVFCGIAELNGTTDIVVDAVALCLGALPASAFPANYVATTSAAIYAPRITYDRGATSNNVPQSQDWATGWTKAGGSDSISGQSLVAGATSGSHALYRSVTMSAAQWTIAAEFAKGSQQATLGVTDGGTDYFAVLDTATGSIVSVQAGATARVEPSVAGWILSVTRTLANATVNAFWGIAKAGSSSFTGGGESVACNGMWTTLGPARGAYLRTFASVPLYAAGTPKSQNLANGSGTQSITVLPGCVYSILHQSGGTYTLSGATTGTTTAGTTTTFVASTSTLTLTASSTPTLLQVWEGTGTMAYVAGPYSLYPQKSLIHEPARTRETLQPRDLTQAAWTKSGSMTAAKTATGIDGVANSASTLTSSGTNQTCLQSVTSASANRMLPCWIRSRSASSLTIDMTCDGGTTWTATTVNAAWMPYLANKATVTNPSYGFRLRANGDAIDVDFVQGEQYTTLPAVPPMPIWGTESAAQTVSPDLIRPPTSYINDTAQTTAVGFIPYNASSGSNQVLLGRTAGGAWPVYLNSAAARGSIFNGTNSASGDVNLSSGVLNRVATRYTSSALGVCDNGGAVGTGATAVAMPGSGNTPGLGEDGSGTNGFWGEFLSLEIATAAANDATLQKAALGLAA